MPIGILGRKVGMTQVFDEDNNSIPVAVVEAGPCPVVQKKTVETDDYNAIQLGFLDQKRQRVKKPKLGHFDKANAPAKRYLREIRLDNDEIQAYEVGQEIKAEIFAPGDYIDVTGYTKGRGFTGVMKRWGFHGSATRTHGTHEYFRHGGAIGSSASPSRVFKGRKMPGRKGNNRVTIQNLQVIEVRPEHNLLLVKGSVPGAANGLLIIRKAKKKSHKSSS
ncbi:50S ribosomal protein L3 [candidate division KSB3 bacterium]|uniref:Large ribosomal subunit protein uL3 n=1 Tax=candidate division KSB3 bacterium TaxID=2044937 RepID=A0A9D5JTI2_9BACT|nr:50S ribosomal protein L3 [candidate division KSB3 bacterium]MBD3323692.1 50S ribosomal protein L3 [candidate division KSB3 bacterium]